MPEPNPSLKGQTVYLASSRTDGGSEYLIGIFATEPEARLATQREFNLGRKVWIKLHIIG